MIDTNFMWMAELNHEVVTDFSELDKLDELLSARGIPHQYNDMPVNKGKQIVLYGNNACTEELDDAILHSFSYGHEAGLLETNHLNHCTGWESAQDVFNGWNEMYKDYWYMSKEDWNEKYLSGDE